MSAEVTPQVIDELKKVVTPFGEKYLHEDAMLRSVILEHRLYN